MNKLACWMVILMSGILAVTAAPTYAAESHFYAATHSPECIVLCDRRAV